MPPLMTPPADHNPIQEAHELLDAIRSTIQDAAQFHALADEPPGLCSGYYLHAVTLAKALGMALQAASGAEQRRCEEAARGRGEEQCRGGCGRWLPQDQIIRRTTGGKEKRANHYWSCVACEGPADDGF